MTVRMENIDELRRRTNVSYEAAKDALEKCNDDLLEAIVYLEKQTMVRTAASEDKESLWDKVKKIVRKGNNTKFIVHKKEATIISIPLTLAVIVGLLAHEITFIAIVLALITGYRIRFESKDVECKKVNELMNKVSDSVDSAKRKLAEDSHSQARTN